MAGQKFASVSGPLSRSGNTQRRLHERNTGDGRRARRRRRRRQPCTRHRARASRGAQRQTCVHPTSPVRRPPIAIASGRTLLVFEPSTLDGGRRLICGLKNQRGTSRICEGKTEYAPHPAALALYLISCRMLHLPSASGLDFSSKQIGPATGIASTVAVVGKSTSAATYRTEQSENSDSARHPSVLSLGFSLSCYLSIRTITHPSCLVGPAAREGSTSDDRGRRLGRCCPQSRGQLLPPACA